jgi:hypothetical protein
MPFCNQISSPGQKFAQRCSLVLHFIETDAQDFHARALRHGIALLHNDE